MVLASGTLLLLAMAATQAVANADELAPAAPTNLHGTPYFNLTALTWQPGEGGGQATFYRIYNLTTGIESPTVETSDRWHGTEGQTYTFEVTAVNRHGESPPSNQVTVTLPTLGPPTGLTAGLAGDTVTLTWSTPAAVDPGVGTWYGIRRGGELETVHLGGGDVVSVSIPRTEPGTTHVYTVQIDRGFFVPGPTSAPTTLVVPPSADTTPPTEPEWVVGLEPDCTPGHQIVVESVDDTTPQASIRYENVERTVRFGTSEEYVADYDLPVRSEPNIGPPTGIRAVDEAGNRSATVFDFEMTPSCQ